MINAELGDVKTVEEFHESIKTQQEWAHGEHYCAMHDAILRYWTEGECKDYLELGTHQGGTASQAMLLPGVENIQLIDIDMSRYRKFLAPLAIRHCAKNKINLKVKEMDSRDLPATARCDMLVSDSVHNPTFMQQELAMHGHNVRKYIIAHDTFRIRGNVNTGLFECLQDFANTRGWKILENNKNNVGYTVIGK